MDTFATKLRDAIDSSLRDSGARLRVASADIATYTAQRAAHLATIVGQAGYDEALIAERDAVCLFAGVSATREADAADQRLVGMFHAALALGMSVA